MTKNDLSHATKIKLSRLNYVMEPLTKNGIIVSERIGQSSGGRKPVLYSVNGYDLFVVGVDISIMYTQIVITNLRMEVVYEELFIMDDTCTPEKTVRKIAAIIEAAYTKLGLDRLQILGAGVGSVGPLNVKTGIIKNPPNFYAKQWSNVPLKAMLEERLKAAVIIENGANAGVVAEGLFGAGKEFENVGYFNCGVGIRTGTISSKNLIRAINDEEEGFGHMVIDIRGKKCRCGNYGCIECYASINAILKRFSEEIKKGRQTMINRQIEDISYIDICAAADHNDALSKEILQEAALILGAGLANYIKLLTPDLVILSGPLMNKSELFYHVCVESTLMRLHADKRPRVSFNRCGYYGEKAMAMGASAMFIEMCLS
jgi:predicted NBD/HSP70 family sugar kinase